MSKSNPLTTQPINYHKCNELNKCKVSPQSIVSTVYVISKIAGEYYVLIHKRSEVMTHPNEYCSQGGSIDLQLGENSYEAALRELKEETGFENPPDGYLFVTPIQQHKNNYKVANYIFFVSREDIISGVKGPLTSFSNEINLEETFDDLVDSIPIPNTGHCLMNIRKNLNHPSHSYFFNINCKYILNKLLK